MGKITDMEKKVNRKILIISPSNLRIKTQVKVHYNDSRDSKMNWKCSNKTWKPWKRQWLMEKTNQSTLTHRLWLMRSQSCRHRLIRCICNRLETERTLRISIRRPKSNLSDDLNKFKKSQLLIEIFRQLLVDYLEEIKKKLNEKKSVEKDKGKEGDKQEASIVFKLFADLEKSDFERTNKVIFKLIKTLSIETCLWFLCL